MRSGDVRNQSLLAQDFAPGQLPAGPSGATGQQGPTGPQGAPGPAGSDAEFNGATAGGDLTGTYPNPRVGLVQAGAADQTEAEGHAFVIRWDELAQIQTDGDADVDNTVQILNSGSQNITVRHPGGQATFAPGVFTTVNVGTMPSILIRSADGARSWLVTCVDNFGSQVRCHGVANRLG